MSPTRVAIVDDHAPFRRELAAALRERGLDVVGEAATAEIALEVVAEARPDVVLLDLRLPGMSGVEAALRLSASPNAPAIVALTVSDDGGDLYGALAAGAVGYLLKDASPDDVAEAVTAARRGDSRVSPALTGKLVERVRALGLRAGEPDVASAYALTDRECEVLRLLARGDDNAQIATHLAISANTVKSHVGRILSKLGVENRTQAAMVAVRRGLV